MCTVVLVHSLLLFGNLTYITGVLGHQTFIARATNALLQQAIYSSVAASAALRVTMCRGNAHHVCKANRVSL